MIEINLFENWGHPWTKDSDWDGLDIEADTEEELEAAIAEKEKEFWCVWISGTRDGKPGAFLYKPHGINREWTEEEKYHGLNKVPR